MSPQSKSFTQTTALCGCSYGMSDPNRRALRNSQAYKFLAAAYAEELVVDGMPIPVFSEFRCGEGAVHGNQLGLPGDHPGTRRRTPLDMCRYVRVSAFLRRWKIKASSIPLTINTNQSIEMMITSNRSWRSNP